MTDKMFDPKVIQGMKDYAKYIAIVVRNAMEDFHCKHLSDEQMKELNPIIRNAIYTAIYAYETQKQSNRSESFCRLSLHVDSKILGRTGIARGIEEVGREKSLLLGEHMVGYNSTLSLNCHIFCARHA